MGCWISRPLFRVTTNGVIVNMEATATPPTTNATKKPKPSECGRLIGSETAARIMGIAESTFHRHRALGLIGPEPILIGKRIRWDSVVLHQWIDAKCPSAKAWKAMIDASKGRGTKSSLYSS